MDSGIDKELAGENQSTIMKGAPVPELIFAWYNVNILLVRGGYGHLDHCSTQTAKEEPQSGSNRARGQFS